MLMKDCAKAVNLRIAIDSLDFWLCFYETITTRLNNLKQYGHIFSHYFEVSQLLLLSCQKVSSIKYEELETEEI